MSSDRLHGKIMKLLIIILYNLGPNARSLLDVEKTKIFVLYYAKININMSFFDSLNFLQIFGKKEKKNFSTLA